MAVLIGLYRFYFYKGRLAEALEVSKECLIKSARDNNFSTDWRDVRAGDADFGRYESLKPRFFLFSLKGYAYLQMRLGELEEGACRRHQADAARPERQDRRPGAARYSGRAEQDDDG